MARDSCCLEAVALTPLCPVAQGWHRTLLSAFPPWQHQPWKGRHGKAPRGRNCTAGVALICWMQFGGTATHVQLMGRCCIVYEDKKFIYKLWWMCLWWMTVSCNKYILILPEKCHLLLNHVSHFLKSLRSLSLLCGLAEPASLPWKAGAFLLQSLS